MKNVLPIIIFIQSSLKGSRCYLAMTKLNRNSFFSSFQAMEIRRPMLQIRRTSHRNTFYESGKMHKSPYE